MKTLFFFFIITQGIAQSKKIDSLLIELNHSKEDTSKIKILLKLSFELRNSASDNALNYAKTALQLSKNIGNKKDEAKAFNNMGLAYYYKSDYINAMNHYNASLKIGKELSDSTIISLEYNQFGNLYKSMSNYPLSIEYLKKALAIRKTMKDTLLLAQSYLNLGNCYVHNSQHELAIKNYLAALDILKTRKQTIEYANVLNGIANVYTSQKNYKKAMEYYMQGYNFSKGNDDARGISIYSLNIGNCYKFLKNYDSALFFLQQTVEIAEKSKNRNNMAEVYLAISTVYEETFRYQKAIDYAKKASDIYNELNLNAHLAEAQLILAHLFLESDNTIDGKKYLDIGLMHADSIKDKEIIFSVYKRVAQCYNLLGDNLNAYHYLEKSDVIKDSIFTSNSIQSIAQMQSTFDLKSKENEIELLNREKQISEYKINRQRTVILSLLGSAVLFSLLVFFIYRGYKKTKIANIALSNAYEVINEKNKNISDSILYAKNIQNALLKIPEYFDRKLKNDYFILYKPKDVVSGDFYWIEQVDKMILIAAADCTGHGVPGSLMSMLGIEKLKQAVREKGFINPSDILSFVNLSFKETLSVNGTESALRDGMDIALCCLNFSDNILYYSGANRPLWIVTTNKKGERELKEIMPTKSAIGGFTDDSQQFQSHQYSPNDGDIIYLFTDGFADQFGGQQNKKFNMKRFRELLPSISHLPMNEQKQQLDSTFNEWRMGNEQVDDVLIIGLKKVNSF